MRRAAAAVARGGRPTRQGHALIGGRLTARPRAVLLLALLLTASSWTGHGNAPTRDAAVPLVPCCPCRDTSSAGPVSGLAALELWRQAPSPFYLANRDSIIAGGPFFAAHWTEAQSRPQLYATILLPGIAPGAPFSFTVPDTLPPAWWSVAWLDPSGNRSCLSNNVWK